MRHYKAYTGKNCLQCCIAMLFDLPLDRVPDVHQFAMFNEAEEEASWFDGLYDWSKNALRHIPVVVTDDTLDDLLHIEVVETLHGVTHAVVAKGMEILRDPYTDAEYHEVRETQYKILFVPLGGIQKPVVALGVESDCN